MHTSQIILNDLIPNSSTGPMQRQKNFSRVSGATKLYQVLHLTRSRLAAAPSR